MVQNYVPNILNPKYALHLIKNSNVLWVKFLFVNGKQEIHHHQLFFYLMSLAYFYWYNNSLLVLFST